MNCLEFRRSYLANPFRVDASMSKHRALCPECASFAGRQMMHEQQLNRALRIEPPENLSAKILFRQSKQRYRRRRALGAAAALILVTASFGAFINHTKHLENAVTEHLQTDPLHTRPAPTGMSKNHRHALQQFNLRLQDTGADLIHAAVCIIDGDPALHLVFGREGEQVTAIILPNNRILFNRKLQTAHGEGRLLANQDGVVALFANNKSLLDAFAKRLHLIVRRAV